LFNKRCVCVLKKLNLCVCAGEIEKKCVYMCVREKESVCVLVCTRTNGFQSRCLYGGVSAHRVSSNQLGD